MDCGGSSYGVKIQYMLLWSATPLQTDLLGFGSDDPGVVPLYQTQAGQERSAMFVTQRALGVDAIL